MRKIKAVFTKQLLSYFHSPGMFALPLAFLAIPLANIVLIPGVTEEARTQIAAQFVVMFVGISMIGSSAGFITEDRLTMNLRFMGMAGVKPYQYLIATCAVLLLISFGVLVLFGLLMGLSSLGDMGNFLSISMLGAASSMLLGITLSLSRFRNFTMLAGLLLGVAPVFAANNEFLASVFSFTYTYHINAVINGDLTTFPAGAARVVLANAAVLLVVFVVTNARNGLDGERLRKKSAAGARSR